MDLLAFLGDSAFHLFRAIVLALPLLIWHWTLRLTRRSRMGNGLADATVIAAAMFGLAALALLVPPLALTWDAIMRPGGVWDLSLLGFLDRALRYLTRTVPALLQGALAGDDRMDVLAWCGVALLVWILRVVALLLSGQIHLRRRLLLAEVIVFTVTAHTAIYLGLLVLWAINQLNFWVILVVLLLLQDYRHNHPPVTRQVLNALTGGRSARQAADPVRAVD